jgi:hypothetical protein
VQPAAARKTQAGAINNTSWPIPPSKKTISSDPSKFEIRCGSFQFQILRKSQEFPQCTKLLENRQREREVTGDP